MTGEAALRDTAFTEMNRTHNQKWLDSYPGMLTAMGLTAHPSIANFILIGFPEGEKTADAADLFLKEQGIILRGMKGYKLPHCLRATIGTDEENETVLAALAEFMK